MTGAPSGANLATVTRHELNTDLASRLRHVRTLRGLSLRALGRAAEVPHPAVVRYERAGGLPDACTLVRLADALDCSTDYLLGRTGVSPRHHAA